MATGRWMKRFTSAGRAWLHTRFGAAAVPMLSGAGQVASGTCRPATLGSLAAVTPNHDHAAFEISIPIDELLSRPPWNERTSSSSTRTTSTTRSSSWSAPPAPPGRAAWPTAVRSTT